VSNVFVPPQTLPSWLQPVAEWNPTSTLTGALRQLWGNPNPYATDSFPSQNPVLVTVAWVVVIIAIFGPLGVRRYRSMSR
jgi:ABC-type multidrug transport system permease subunit